MAITFPIKRLIRISLGNVNEMYFEFQKASGKRILAIHFWTLLTSIFLTFLSSFVHYSNFLAVPELQQFTQAFNIVISPISIFAAYLPVNIITFILFLIGLFMISLLFFIVSKLLKSTITLNVAVYPMQLLGIFYVYFQLITILMFLSTKIPILFPIFTLILFILMIYFIYRLAKTFNQVTGHSTFIYLFTLILVIAMIAAILGYFIQSVMSNLPIAEYTAQAENIQ
ncbi:MAG: hypothetical protein CXT77_04915 [uncultured DHVE6 group euryarchaeote]|nr:MAG: hypothetical protein CXT77_04915 [uncultured DHVE6 group euryarchaeote]